ncbi:MAG: rod shape-determining protein RodA [Coriobacteriaceae bacterium]|nr:rod shape-determining protein RodA [Coriobacteriaceae bacterium]
MARMRTISQMRRPDAAMNRAARIRKRGDFPVPIPFIVSIALVTAYGLIVSFSATANDPDYNFTRQLMGVLVGAVLMVLLWRFDFRQLGDYATVFMVVNIVLILSPHLPLLGVESNGALSWVHIGPARFQPGEFAKVTVILMDACIMAKYRGKLDDPREYLKALGLMSVPFICIMTQPDLGTGLVYLFIAGIALLIGGARPKYLGITVGVVVVLVVAVFLLDPVLDAAMGRDVLLKDYQRARLLVFMDSTYDTSGDGYNLTQAKIAVGSGGLLGKGFMNATQSTLGFLPEAPTDFVFCVLAEEFGFLGALALLAMYLGLIISSLRIARNSQSLFGLILVVCIVGMWCFQILENIGMDIGLMPITGIPLPFVSYGSSFMVVNFICLGLIGSVWVHNGVGFGKGRSE